MSFVILTTHSPKIAELTGLTLPNKRAYCDLHGYELEVVPFPDDDGSVGTAYAEGYRRMLSRCDALLMEGVGVMQMDADAWFTNRMVRIEDRIKEDDDMIAAREPEPNSRMNGGVVIARPTAGSLRYYRTVLEHFDEWKTGPLGPQGWIAGALLDTLRIVSPSEINAIPEERVAFPHTSKLELWKPGDWICHCYGLPIEKKIAWARRLCR